MLSIYYQLNYCHYIVIGWLFSQHQCSVKIQWWKTGTETADEKVLISKMKSKNIPREFCEKQSNFPTHHLPWKMKSIVKSHIHVSNRVICVFSMDGYSFWNGESDLDGVTHVCVNQAWMCWWYLVYPCSLFISWSQSCNFQFPLSSAKTASSPL